MLIKKKLKEIHFKVVYFGPSMSGKTTNLERIHRKINPDLRSSMISIKTFEDRTLYFDFTQLNMSKINGLTPKFDLYTIPGQPRYYATRKIILQGVDGVVFVADSDPCRLDDNIRSYNDLKHLLTELGKPVNKFPIILQCNKQDLPQAMAPEILKEQLESRDIPNYAAVAIQNIGIFETLKEIIIRLGKEIISA